MTSASVRAARGAFWALALFLAFGGAAWALDGVALYPARDAESGLYGYADAEGNVAIAPSFAAANPFLEEGVAWVQGPEGYFAIDREGRKAYEPTPNFEDVPWIGGEPAFPALAASGLWGLMGPTGTWVHEPLWEELGTFSSQGLAVAKEGRWEGLVDLQGAWVVAPRFSYLLNYFDENGLALAADQEGTLGFINRQGEWAIGPGFAALELFDGRGLAVAKPSPTQAGIIDLKGEWALAPRFLSISPFGHGGFYIAQSQSTGLFGLINGGGDWVKPPEFKALFPWGEMGLAVARSRQGRFGYVSARGEWALAPLYADLQDFDPQTRLAPAALSENLVGLISPLKKWAVAPQYFSLEYFPFLGLYMAQEEESGRVGLLSPKGEWVLKPLYERLVPFYPREPFYVMALDPSSRKWGMVNLAGEWLIEPILERYDRFFEALGLLRGTGPEGRAVYLNSRGERRVPVGYRQDLEREISFFSAGQP
ncbi:MAG: WG repeat-containing protein [Deltaproteobacteria bacterium]|nr:WG repeat-containing protein [Deltaproteobacteria bacterium]